MNPRIRGWSVVPWLVLMAAPAAVAAQDDLLARADQAYVEVNFAQALQLAQQALETGDYGPAELEHIYRLIGVAAAAQGEDERSVDAYVRMFALNPDAQMDENLSPRLRQPFMEALGRWSARRGRFAMEVRRLRDSRGVGLSLEDPVSLAARVIVYTRVAGRDAEFAETELAAAPSLAVPLSGLSSGDTVEVYARALDAYGNGVLELGSAVEPHVLEGQAAVVAAGPAALAAPARPPAATTTQGGGISPWFFVAGAALTAVSAGVLGWSIADVLQSHDDYLREPTLDKYYYGLDLQTRTNALIVTTSALGVASVLLAIFTEWSTPAPATDAAGARWTLFASPTSAGAAVTGSF